MSVTATSHFLTSFFAVDKAAVPKPAAGQTHKVGPSRMVAHCRGFAPESLIEPWHTGSGCGLHVGASLRGFTSPRIRGCSRPAGRRCLLRAACRLPPSASPRAATFFSDSSTTTIATATGAASRPRRGLSPTSASRPSAAGAAATRPAPPASSTATASPWRADDPRTSPRRSRKTVSG